MSKWLQKRLVWWFGGALALCLMVGGAARLRAQDEEFGSSRKAPRAKLTRDEAAKSFADLMDLFSQTGAAAWQRDSPASEFAEIPESISMASTKLFGRRISTLVLTMADQWKSPNQTVKVQSESAENTVVTLETAPTLSSRPLILVQENGGWGVDLVETFGLWNNRNRADNAVAIYKLTGAELPGLEQAPEYLNFRENNRRSQCQTQLKQIALAIKQYTQDYDEKFPIAGSNRVRQSVRPFSEPFGWADAVQPYSQNLQIFQCPSEPTPGQEDAVQRQFTDYWYNSRLSNQNEAALSFISNTVLNGDGNTGQDLTTARYSTRQIPQLWLQGTNWPSSRHLGGMNFSFADGHVKWLKAPKTPMNDELTPNTFSFRLN